MVLSHRDLFLDSIDWKGLSIVQMYSDNEIVTHVLKFTEINSAIFVFVRSLNEFRKVINR